MTEISIVTPMYNEYETLDLYFERLIPILEEVTPSYEVICVDDGSSDGTLERLRVHHRRNPNIKIVSLSRNFGKEAALTSGLDYASGRAVIPVDADLQDPPEILPEMIQKWREGAQVVLARRGSRSEDTAMKRFSAHWFYRLFSRVAETAIPENVGDFRLMDRAVVNALGQLPERSRFMKGLFAWVGFRTVEVVYAREARAAGETKFNYWKLWNFAIDGLLSFSTLPLKIWTYLGFALSAYAGVYLIYLLTKTMIYGADVPGYASTLSVVLFFNGIILLGMGVMGEYIARLFIEVKRRPLYLVNEVDGFPTSDIAPMRQQRHESLEPNKIARS